MFGQDTTPPVMVVPPMSSTARCEANPIADFTAWYNAAAGAVATDNSGTVILIGNPPFNVALNFLNASKDTLCGTTKKVTVSWKAFDPSNNATPAYAATFSVIDTDKPAIINQPNSLSLECTSSAQDSLIKWIKRQGGARAADVCSETVIWTKYIYVTSTGKNGTDSIGSGPYPVIPQNNCNWFVNVSFIVMDECGNEEVTSIRKFEIKDTKSPVFSTMPPDVTVQCSDVPAKPNITASDACNGSTLVTFSETNTQNPDTTKCDHYRYSITRKWNTKDICNNALEHIQKISVIDDKAPIVLGPVNKTIDCSKSNNLDSLLTQKKDNCSKIKLTYVDTITSGSGCSVNLRRKYTASDVCNNIGTFTQLLNVVDKSAPTISSVAKNKGVDCRSSDDVNIAFNQWLVDKANSIAIDQCSNGVKSFVAKPGSYNLKDTLTFPGVHPGVLDVSSCDNVPKGFSRAEKVDFVFYDKCGNASVTSAFFGVVDTIAPSINNCQSTISKEVETADCSASLVLTLPNAFDECSPSMSPQIRTATASIKSSTPGDNEILVDPIELTFGPYNPNTFQINDGAILQLDFIELDGDDTSEYFRIYDENNKYLGKTNNTPQQCKNATTIVNLSKSDVQSLVADGTIKIKLVPNVGPIPVLSINDVCVGTRVNATLTFPIENGNLVRSYYIEKNNKDTVEVSGQTTYTKKFTTGEYDAKFIFVDCAKNISSCAFTIKINDKITPTISCPKDTVLSLTQFNCSQAVSLPLNFNVMDNCSFPELYNAVAPANADAQKITFAYIENKNIHIANNKLIVFDNAPLIKYADSDAELIVNITGDINNAKEYYYLIDENGTTIGQTGIVLGPNCASSSTSFIIPKSTYNNWAADGKIEITAFANNEGDEEGMGINPCNPITPSQTVDEVSKISLRLITRQPVLTYKLDNESEKTIAKDANNLNLNLSATKHKIVYSSKDNAGNIGSCTVNVEVKDNVSPIARCKNVIAKIHPSGLIDYKITADSINNGSTDNCAIDSLWTNAEKISCADVGTEKTITLTVSDKYKNTSSCESKVKIEATSLKPSFSTGLCEGDTLRLFANIPPPVDNNVFTYEWYKDNVLVSTSVNPIFPGTNSTYNGQYKVIVKGFNNCSAEGFMTINIKPLTTPSISNKQESYCDNEQILLQTDNFTGTVKYEWYEGFPPNGVLIAQTDNPEYQLTTSVGIHNYYVLGRSPECVSNPSLTTRVFVYSKPTINLCDNFINVCEGQEIKLCTSTTGQNFQYSWTGPDGFEFKAQNPGVIKNVSNKNQGKYYLVVNIGKCISDTASTNVVVLPKPGKPIITGENVYCEKSTFSLVVNNIAAQEKYIWIKDNVRYRVTQDNSLEVVNVPLSLSGNWRVVAESNSCMSDTSDVKNIEIDNLSLVGASNDGPICEGDTVNLNATFVPNAIYTWKGPNNFKANGQNVKTVASAGEYSVTIKSTTGCENSAFTVVDVNKSPIITALSNNSIGCVDGKTDVVFFPSIIPDGNFIYKWTGPNNYSSSDKNPKILNVNPSNNGAYILSVFNKNCPSKPDTSFINVQLVPTKADWSIPASICEGDTLDMTTSAIADTFYWNTPNGVFTTSSKNFSIPNIKKSNQGNYYLLIKKNGCSSIEFNVSYLDVNDRPLPSAIVGKSEICFGETTSLSISNSALNNATWVLPNGSNYTGLTLPLINATTLNSGTYKVIGIKNNCSSLPSNDFFLKVRNKIEEPILVNNKIEVCGDENQTIEACVDPIELGLTYKWIRSADQSLLINTLDECIKFNSNDYALGNTFFSIKAIKEGCESITAATFQLSKNISPNIKAEANINEIAVCNTSDIITLSSSQKPPITDVKWTSLTNGVTVLSPNNDKTVVQNFKKGVNLIVLSYSKDGCNNFSTDTVKIFVLDAPKAFDDVVEVTFNENKNFDVLTNDSIGKFYTIEIEEPSDGNLNGNDGKYVFEPHTGFAGNALINYKICIEGCENLCDEAKVILQVGKNIGCVVPSIFTPNEDGINDALVIPCLNANSLNGNELIIFNQWGDEVYSAKPYNNDWKGTYSDEPLPVGTYFYIFNPGNGKNKLNGFITLQR